MKRRLTMLWVVLGIITASLLSFATELHGAAAKVSQVKVRSVHGNAKYKADANAKWLILKSGMNLAPGTIETDEGAQLELWLVEIGSAVQLKESTQLDLEKLDYTKAYDEIIITAELNLKAGTIVGQTKKMAVASRYEVKFSNGVCKIAGTDFIISANGEVHIGAGIARVHYTVPGGKIYTNKVSAGESYFPPADAANEPRITKMSDAISRDFLRVIHPTP